MKCSNCNADLTNRASVLSADGKQFCNVACLKKWIKKGGKKRGTESRWDVHVGRKKILTSINKKFAEVVAQRDGGRVRFRWEE